MIRLPSCSIFKNSINQVVSVFLSKRNILCQNCDLKVVFQSAKLPKTIAFFFIIKKPPSIRRLLTTVACQIRVNLKQDFHLCPFVFDVSYQPCGKPMQTQVEKQPEKK